MAESGKATLRRLNEKRSAWHSSADIRSRSLSRPSIFEERAFSIPISAVSRTSFESLEQGPITLEESRSTFNLPAGISTLVDGEMAFHGDEGDPSYPVPPFQTALANLQKPKSASVAKTLGVPASTSADVGLWLLTQAMDGWRERSLYLDSVASFEATMSVDLSLGEVPSFLDTREYLCFITSVFFFHSILLSRPIRLPSLAVHVGNAGPRYSAHSIFSYSCRRRGIIRHTFRGHVHHE